MKQLPTVKNTTREESRTHAVKESASVSVSVISKVLLILEALQNSAGGLGLKAICDDTGINKSTAHRFAGGHLLIAAGLSVKLEAKSEW